jgi:hypothetical protein
VEAERMILNFFEWDVGFLLPIHFLEIYLANGVLFENEKRKEIPKTKTKAREISARCN